MPSLHDLLISVPITFGVLCFWAFLLFSSPIADHLK